MVESKLIPRGARHCTIVESFEEFAAQARYAADLYDYNIDVLTENIYIWRLTAEERFDYVLFPGLFYHLKYPELFWADWLR